MSEPSFGYRPRHIRLLDAQLTLDPAIQQMMLEMEAKMAARQMIQQWRQPNFEFLLPRWESILAPPPNPFLQPVPAPVPSPFAFKPGAGPATPKAGELSDVMGAVYKLPVVQRMVEQAHDEGFRQLRILRSEWQSASTGDKVMMVTVSGIVVGGMVTTIVANQPTRDMAFNLIKDKDIPIPGVKGLSFKIMDKGAGATVPLGVPGLSAKGHFNAPDGKPMDYGATINFDLMEFLRKK